jgi:DNA polymerase-4
MADSGLERRIIHVDMDAFYASVEQLDDQSLRGKPVIVGGSSHRGVVSAASYEARAFGIHSAMPMAQARRLCPNGFFLPVRMERYREISSSIREIFHRYTPLVEPLSLDEAFLDVTGSGTLFGDSEKIAGRIRKEILQTTGLTASAGVASSKLVAKIASDLNKPDGMTVVPPGTEREFLSPLPIGRLWGAGKVTIKTLKLLGVSTIGDLRKLSRQVLESRFGRNGTRLYEVCRGIDNRPVVPDREVKSIGHEDTYETDLIHMADIKRELLHLSNRVAARMRLHGKSGRTITLKTKYSNFVQSTRSITLATATNDHRLIYEKVVHLLPQTAAGKKPVRLLGVTLSNLQPDDAAEQMQLFAPLGNDPGQRKKINRVLDKINERFGTATIRPAALLHPRK